MSLKLIYAAATLACLGVAHRMCTSCIPLEDLLAPGYGISISTESLSSAASYHNGTAAILSTISASEEYRTLLSTILAQHNTEQPRYTAMRCPARHRLKPPRKESPKPIWAYAFDLLKVGFTSPNTLIPAETQSRLGPVAKIFQAQFLALEPFASMSAGQLAEVAVAVQIPAWLISSPYACDLWEAAKATFGRSVGLENPASSAYTVLGYELCRVAQDAYDCTGPGRLAVFEYNGRLATASVIKTPVDFLDRLSSQYTLLESTDPAELSIWIKSFVGATAPEMITLAGSHVDQSIFQRALLLSDTIDQVQSLTAVRAEDILVLGAAQVSKDDLENHDSDCGEFDECLDVRMKADELAGRYTYPRPRKWPAGNSRHWREWIRSSAPRMMGSLLEMQTPLFDQNGYVVGF